MKATASEMPPRAQAGQADRQAVMQWTLRSNKSSSSATRDGAKRK